MGLILAQRHLPLYIVTVPRRHIANHFLIKFSFNKLWRLTWGYSQLYLLHRLASSIYCLPPKMHSTLRKVLAYFILYLNRKKRLTIEMTIKIVRLSGDHPIPPPKSTKFPYPQKCTFVLKNQIRNSKFSEPS